jgi:hypothetical protein
MGAGSELERRRLSWQAPPWPALRSSLRAAAARPAPRWRRSERRHVDRGAAGEDPASAAEVRPMHALARSAQVPGPEARRRTHNRPEGRRRSEHAPVQGRPANLPEARSRRPHFPLLPPARHRHREHDPNLKSSSRPPRARHCHVRRRRSRLVAARCRLRRLVPARKSRRSAQTAARTARGPRAPRARVIRRRSRPVCAVTACRAFPTPTAAAGSGSPQRSTIAHRRFGRRIARAAASPRAKARLPARAIRCSKTSCSHSPSACARTASQHSPTRR